MNKNHQPSYALARIHLLCSISWYSQSEFCIQLHSLLLVSFYNCYLLYTLECSALHYLVVNPCFAKYLDPSGKFWNPQVLAYVYQYPPAAIFTPPFVFVICATSFVCILMLIPHRIYECNIFSLVQRVNPCFCNFFKSH